MQTLLIIDMQTAWLEENPRYDCDAVIQRINQVAEHFRQAGKPVIFVRHDDQSAQKGSPAWQVTTDIPTMHTDLFVDKTACDSYASTTLLECLRQSKTKELVICGLATEFCVDTTLRASLSHGFDVIALADAHTTANRPHLDAATIISHHNWIWTHMAAPNGVSSKVMRTAEFLASGKSSSEDIQH